MARRVTAGLLLAMLLGAPLADTGCAWFRKVLGRRREPGPAERTPELVKPLMLPRATNEEIVIGPPAKEKGRR